MIIIAVIVVITGLGFRDGPRTFAFFDSCVFIIKIIAVVDIVVITGLRFGDGPRTFAFFDSCVIIIEINIKIRIKIKINIKIIIAAAGFVSFLQGFAADWFPQGPVFSSIRIPVR